MMKKRIAFLLVLALMIGLVPGTVLAQDSQDNPWEGKSATFVGDSIAYGSKTTKIFYQYLKESLNLGSVISNAVAGRGISAMSDYGHSKQPLIDIYKNISPADLIVIFLGTNDYGHETPLGTPTDTEDVSFYGALNVIVPGMVKAYPSSKIVFVTPIHRYGFGSSKITGVPFTNDSTPNGYGATLGDYAEAMKAVCAAHNVSVIDLYTEYPLDPSDATVRSKYMSDGLHPNAEGHKMMADVMEAHIRTYTPVEADPEAPADPEVPAEPEVQAEEMIYGNKFVVGYSQQNRVSSLFNLYLKAGTTITFHHADTMQWACARTSSETSTNNLGYFPDSAWTSKTTAEVKTDSWVGFTFKFLDDSKSFDLANPLSYYITIKGPHEHVYDHAYDLDCNDCAAVREVMAPVTCGGTSVSENTNGLAFLFNAEVKGFAVNGKFALYDNATVDGFRVLSMGALITNGIGDVDVPCAYLCYLEENSASFAVRIINISSKNHDVPITATPYMVLEINGVATTLYGEAQTCSYNDAKN